MADFPALPLWTDAYLADTTHLTTEQHGAYCLLLFKMWRQPECDLPDDHKLLARLAGIQSAKWPGVWSVLKDFFLIGDNGRWTQKRLTKEREYVNKRSGEEYREQRRVAGRASAAKREAQRKSNGPLNEKPNGISTEVNEATPTPTPTPKEESSSLRSDVSAASADPPEIPKFLDRFGSAVDEWNALAVELGLAAVRERTDGRRRKFGARFSNGSGGKFAEALAAVRASKFCQGDNNQGWRVNFDFLLQPSSLAKLLEGTYADRDGAAQDSTGVDWDALKAKDARDAAE